jgi:hypothetical protein
LLTPHQRTLRARLGAYASWAATADPSARTAKARRALDDKFIAQVDPDGTLPSAERDRRVAAARKAYFTRLALQSSRARSRRAGGGDTEKEAAS